MFDRLLNSFCFISSRRRNSKQIRVDCFTPAILKSFIYLILFVLTSPYIAREIQGHIYLLNFVRFYNALGCTRNKTLHYIYFLFPPLIFSCNDQYSICEEGFRVSAQCSDLKQIRIQQNLVPRTRKYDFVVNILDDV